MTARIIIEIVALGDDRGTAERVVAHVLDTLEPELPRHIDWACRREGLDGRDSVETRHEMLA